MARGRSRPERRPGRQERERIPVTPGPDDPRSVAEFLEGKDDVWERIVEKHDLRPIPLRDILGESHHYADFCFAYGATEQPPPAFVSTVKIKQAGFCETYDTEASFAYWLRVLQDRQVLPPPH